jgi:nuclear pore complex protein Nup93
MAESDFNELLHAAEQLSAEVEGSGDLPKVERTLRQVVEASTELWSRVTQAGAQDIQAYVYHVSVQIEAIRVGCVKLGVHHEPVSEGQKAVS